MDGEQRRHEENLIYTKINGKNSFEHFFIDDSEDGIQSAGQNKEDSFHFLFRLLQYHFV